MKRTPVLLVLMFSVLMIINCNGQPKSEYEIGCNNVAGAVEYKFFLEKKSANPYVIQQGIDYLDPNGDGNYTDSLTAIGISTNPLYTIKLNNDGSEYRVAVVAVNSAGTYSGMGTFTGNVNQAPNTPGAVFFRKKQ